MRLGLDIGWYAGVAIDTIEAIRDASLGGLWAGAIRASSPFLDSFQRRNIFV